MKPRYLLRLALVVCLVSCTPPVATGLDPMIVIAPQRPAPWPAARVAAPDAPPAIERIWFSTLHLREGSSIHGAIATSTNVASVEVRTATFSVNVPRKSFGQFNFQLDVLVFPPLLKHTYPLLIIARNAAGVAETKTAYLIVE